MRVNMLRHGRICVLHNRNIKTFLVQKAITVGFCSIPLVAALCVYDLDEKNLETKLLSDECTLCTTLGW